MKFCPISKWSSSKSCSFSNMVMQIEWTYKCDFTFMIYTYLIYTYVGCSCSLFKSRILCCPDSFNDAASHNICLITGSFQIPVQFHIPNIPSFFAVEFDPELWGGLGWTFASTEALLGEGRSATGVGFTGRLQETHTGACMCLLHHSPPFFPMLFYSYDFMFLLIFLPGAANENFSGNAEAGAKTAQEWDGFRPEIRAERAVSFAER